jgi:hypothetical protein
VPSSTEYPSGAACATRLVPTMPAAAPTFSTTNQKLPAIYSTSTFVRSGGLIGYGFDRADLFHRAAGYVDRILKWFAVIQRCAQTESDDLATFPVFGQFEPWGVSTEPQGSRGGWLTYTNSSPSICRSVPLARRMMPTSCQRHARSSNLSRKRFAGGSPITVREMKEGPSRSAIRC